MKRLVDILGSISGLLLLSPVLLVLAFLVRHKHGSPILFAQVRPGLGGKPFRMMKFRTMTDERDESGDLLPGAHRLTSFGKKLRDSSLDELPGLINVLRGDMSLVGPRPLLMDYLRHYNDFQNRRHEVKPGLTGWAQVNGRNNLSWDEKFEMDVWYVDNRSLFLDIKIIWKTILKVLRRSDVTDPGQGYEVRFDKDKT
ncbi:sugar transferase [Alcanivorax sp.]|uniref:sugar transferase n=1 Tax=Alcanivorax sp. TaxID=1872427 RepID=UPI003A91BC65